MTTRRTVKVFIASPSDLAVERRAFKDVIDELNTGYGRGAHVRFEPLGWEDAIATVGRRSQSVINQDVDACDVFVLVMWRRWGQEAPDAAPYSSYTEEEFYRALSRFEKQQKPTIFVFFKHIDPGQMADPGPQLAKVLGFRKKLEETRSVIYRGFGDENSFRAEIDKHMTAFVEGECETGCGAHTVPIIPDSIRAEMEKHREAAEQTLAELERMRGEADRALREAEQARADAKHANARADAAARVAESTAAAHSLRLAQDGARAALEGRIEEARQDFAKALDGTTNTYVLYLGFEFFERIGELAEAERLLRRWLAISGPDAETASTASAYSNLGLILRTRGEFDEAEAMHRRSLAIAERLGSLEGIATGYNNLGIVLQIRGDLDGAESMLRNALDIHEKLGFLEGIAGDLGNLAVILQIRHDLDGAEAMHRRSLAIAERLGRSESVASQYANLGLIMRKRGDLDTAEAMHLKALEINEKLARLEGMAEQYGNLGSVKKARGDLTGARELWSKARDLFGKLGARHEADRVQNLIDDLAK